MVKWNAALYDNKHDFVAEYGKGLLEYVPRNKNQSILDLGCGTGMLTSQLTHFADKVIGVDSSESMISKAREYYTNLQFMVYDALSLPFEKEFDVVFSNAVFHWIGNHDALLKQVYKVLKPGGLLVCEFGAHGNIETIEKAFSAACQDFGYQYIPQFNFPTVGNFTKLLKKNGFIIEMIYDYDRPTALKDHEKGLEYWMKQFFASDLELMPEKMQEDIIKKVENSIRESLWNGKEWVADYRRLRVIAHI